MVASVRASHQRSSAQPNSTSGNVAAGGLHHQHPESLQTNRAFVTGGNPAGYEHSGGRGGAGNIGFNDGITDTTAPGPHNLNSSHGRGGEGNIDPVMPGPDGEYMSANYGGRGVYSRDSAHATKVDNNHGEFIKPPTDQHVGAKKPTLADKVIGKFTIVFILSFLPNSSIHF